MIEPFESGYDQGMAESSILENQTARAYMQAMLQLRASLDDSLANGRILACLTLLYSAIDVLASTDAKGEKTRKAFMRWVEEYMFPNHKLRFSALDLFAARSGIVHAFSAESDLSRAGKAKKLVYAWGTASADSLRQAGHVLGRNEVTVHVGDLIDGFWAAVVKYVDEVADHPKQHEQFFKSVEGWYVSVDSSLIDQFLVPHSKAMAAAAAPDSGSRSTADN